MIRNTIMYIKTLGLKGLLKAIEAKATKRRLLLKINRPDCKHPFQLRIPSSDAMTYKQIFIDLEYNFSVKTKPKTIIDAGANIGLASIYFANKYPDAKIIAIEPEQRNFELLKKNLAPYPQITAIQAALWNKKETINLIDPGAGEWGFRTETSKSSTNLKHKSLNRVPAVTVNDLAKEFNLKHIDILKIDIEGAEKEVFSDPSPWINKVESIIIELHERFKSGCEISFHNASEEFKYKWRQGENMYASRGNCINSQSN